MTDGSRTALRLLVALLPALWLADACLAQPAERVAPPASRARVSGEAVVVAKADRVVIEIGVVSEAAEAATAVARGAEGVGAVLAALERELGESAEISSQGYSLQPRHRYVKDRGPELEGYTVRSLLRVVSEDVGLAGRVIDTATRAGASEIHGLRFEVADASAAERQALRDATQRARGKADEVASALGLRVSRVLSLEEAGSEPLPLPRFEAGLARVQGEAAPTPIEAAGVPVRARVLLEVELAR